MIDDQAPVMDHAADSVAEGELRRLAARLTSIVLMASLLILAGKPIPATGSTNVSGIITGNQTWTVAGSPYVLVDHTTLAAGATLTVEPGVVVQSAGNFLLNINGSFTAIGIPADPITFSVEGGIRFYGGEGSIAWAEFLNAPAGLRIQPGGPSLNLHDVEFRDNDSYGIEAYAPFSVLRGRFYNSGRGVYGTSQGHLDRVLVRDNWVNSIEVADGNNWLIERSNILPPPGWAYCGAGGSYASYSLQVGTAFAVSATSNWWGTTNSAEVNQCVFDGNDDPTKGIVAKDPIATSPFDVSPPSSVIAPGSNGIVHSSIGSITGTAEDDPLGSTGVSQTQVSLKDMTTGLFWDGDSWEDNEVFRTASGTSGWSITAPGLVAGRDYRVRSLSSDLAGNIQFGATAHTFRAADSPNPPTGVTATAGDSSATVTWSTPSFDGGTPILEYAISSSPVGVSASVEGGQTAGAVTGLTNGVSYTFVVSAHNAIGSSPNSSPSNLVTPTVSLPDIPGAGPFAPVPPTRILDTRPGESAPDGISGAIPPNSAIDVQVSGLGGLPTSTVLAAVLNVTATDPQQDGYLTVYPKGVTQPVASNLNFTSGQTVPNQVEVAVGEQGKITLFNGSAGTVHVIADVQGYVKDTLIGNAGNVGLFKALPPARILDTRSGIGGFGGPIPANSSINLKVAGMGGVPVSTVGAVVMNATVTEPGASGFLTFFPAGQSQPLVSNLNFNAEQTVPNRLHVPLDNSGEVTVFNGSPSTVHVIADINGWFTDGNDPAASGGLFKGLTPARITDTRPLSGSPYAGMTLSAGGTLQVDVAGQGGVPTMFSSTPPSAVVANVTVVGPTHPGYLTVYPSNVSLPTISDLNWIPGEVRPNLAVLKLSTDGTIRLFNGSSGNVDLVIDVMGWYS